MLTASRGDVDVDVDVEAVIEPARKTRKRSVTTATETPSEETGLAVASSPALQSAAHTDSNSDDTEYAIDDPSDRQYTPDFEAHVAPTADSAPPSNQADVAASSTDPTTQDTPSDSSKAPHVNQKSKGVQPVRRFEKAKVVYCPRIKNLRGSFSDGESAMKKTKAKRPDVKLSVTDENEGDGCLEEEDEEDAEKKGDDSAEKEKKQEKGKGKGKEKKRDD
jgi:hypothetical protein